MSSICSTAASDPRTAKDAVDNLSTGPPFKRFLTVNMWCERYSLSRSTFYALVGSGRLKAVRVAGRTLVSLEEAERWVNSAIEAQS